MSGVVRDQRDRDPPIKRTDRAIWGKAVNNIAIVRKQKGVTLVGLADRMGCHWTTVARHQSGRIPMSPGLAHRYATALDCEISELFVNKATLVSEGE